MNTSGVRQARTTVTYLSQRDQAMPLVLPQSYGPVRGIRPVKPHTVGDHIRKRRLGLKMLQRGVAELIGVCKPSVVNLGGEPGAVGPRYMPAIIRFLG